MASPPTSQQLLKYLNQARQNPQSLIPHIKQQLGRFTTSSKMQLFPGMFYTAQQGKPAWQQAISFLQSQNPIPGLQLNKPLCMASKQHANDLSAHNMFSHTGSNGSTMANRIKKYTSSGFTGTCGENLAQSFKFQGRNSALQAIISLIIDDGVQDRGHRRSIFNPTFKYCGTASSEGDQHYIIVIDYSSQSLQEKNGVLSPVQNKPAPQQQPTKPNQHQQQYSDNSDRYPISQHTNIQTSKSGGKTTIEKKTTTKYSDGSQEIRTEIQTKTH